MPQAGRDPSFGNARRTARTRECIRCGSYISGARTGPAFRNGTRHSDPGTPNPTGTGSGGSSTGRGPRRCRRYSSLPSSCHPHRGRRRSGPPPTRPRSAFHRATERRPSTASSGHRSRSPLPLWRRLGLHNPQGRRGRAVRLETHGLSSSLALPISENRAIREQARPVASRLTRARRPALLRRAWPRKSSPSCAP